MFVSKIKLRMEMGNMSKSQQPDQRVDNSCRTPMGLQHREKITHSEGGPQLAPK